MTKRIWLYCVVMAVVAVFFSSTRSGAGYPQSSQGPNQQPGENVPIPKGQQAPPPEQKQPEKVNPSQIYTLSTTTNLVNVDVLVTDSDGDPITNLQKDNFRVYDDGVQQTISNFGAVQA